MGGGILSGAECIYSQVNFVYSNHLLLVYMATKILAPIVLHDLPKQVTSNTPSLLWGRESLPGVI